MKLILRSTAILLSATTMFSAEMRNPSDNLSQGVVVHEWGTFTSIANETGNSARWAALSGPSDLPCFVARLADPNFKDVAAGLVRMETPVLYFYSKAATNLSVRVGFPEGWITEWYPRATSVTPANPPRVYPSRFTNGEIRWDDVQVAPGQTPALPVSNGASHYFAARETDSAPVRIGKQWEKLIFYRGVGDFGIPLRPVIQDSKVRITNAGSETVPLVILFDNRAGKVGYRAVSGVHKSADVDFPELTGSITDLRASLVNHLVEFGLYKKEAAAMVETWSDSWFEEGMRLFYIVPRTMVDRVLPLAVSPSPEAVARVFVGRIELLSPGTRQRIDTLAAAGDTKGLERMGRFLGPFVTQLERTQPEWQRPAAVQSVFQRPRQSAGCVQ